MNVSETGPAEVVGSSARLGNSPRAPRDGHVREIRYSVLALEIGEWVGRGAGSLHRAGVKDSNSRAVIWVIRASGVAHHIIVTPRHSGAAVAYGCVAVDAIQTSVRAEPGEAIAGGVVATNQAVADKDDAVASVVCRRAVGHHTIGTKGES